MCMSMCKCKCKRTKSGSGANSPMTVAEQVNHPPTSNILFLFHN